MVWSHADNWLLSSDHGGFIKYWQSNMNNVKMYEAHKEPIRGLRLATLVPRTQHSGLLLAVFVGIVELIKLFLVFFFVECVKHILFRSTKIVKKVTVHPTGYYLRWKQIWLSLQMNSIKCLVFLIGSSLGSFIYSQMIFWGM